MTNSELLRAFVERRDHEAFSQLVRRHADLVYSAATRQVGTAMADDVAQAVFILLLNKASRIDGRMLPGWLVNAAKLSAAAAWREEQRRKKREHKAAMMRNEEHVNDSSGITGTGLELDDEDAR